MAKKNAGLHKLPRLYIIPVKVMKNPDPDFWDEALWRNFIDGLLIDAKLNKMDQVPSHKGTLIGSNEKYDLYYKEDRAGNLYLRPYIRIDIALNSQTTFRMVKGFYHKLLKNPVNYGIFSWDSSDASAKVAGYSKEDIAETLQDYPQFKNSKVG